MDFGPGQFGGDLGGNFGGNDDMFGGGDQGFGQFPSMGDMFGAGDDAEDVYDVNAFVRQARAKDASRFLDVGLHFFGALKRRR